MSTNKGKSENSRYFSILKNFEENGEILRKMFEHPEVKDRPIVVLTITGTKKRGKSFFINNCLKFLYANLPSINFLGTSFQNSDKWFDEELSGFPWGRNNHDSNDVLMWNDIFLYKNELTSEKLAIVVMDMSSASDSSTNQEDPLKILEFLTKISSIQMVNLSNEVDQHQLEFLKASIESGKAGAVGIDQKSLEQLVFLVRDWNNLDEFSYGIENGENYLMKLLKSGYNRNLKSTLELFKATFKGMHCMLLPHPGNTFVNNGYKIDEEFKDETIAGIQCLFKPEFLIPKNVNNLELKGSHFYEYIQHQVSSYHKLKTQSNEISENQIELSKGQINLPLEHPIQVLKFTDDNGVSINDEGLKKLFQHEELIDRKIVALSSIGVSRKGKSFLLNYCLRYLYAHYPSINRSNELSTNSENWMGDKNEPLTGFSWRSGSVRDTSGIVIWNDAFLHIDDNGEKIAIILIDTQGLFQSGTLPIDDSRIFSLGTLFSSLLVLNLFDVVQENQLEYLQYSIETAKYAIGEKQETEEKPFQHLMFLIRDWGNHDDHPCGLEGGNEYLKYFLKSKSDKKEEIKSTCEVIYDSFDEINCFLLPHPGNAVAVGKIKNQKYEGNWSNMDDDFKDELKKVIEFLLNSRNLVPRKVNGVSLTAPEYFEYVQKCIALFQSDELPQVKTICDSTVDKDMNKLINLCFGSCKDVIRSKLKDIKNRNDLHHLYETAMKVGMDLYDKSKKMGDNEHEEKYRKILEDKIKNYMKEVAVKEERNFKAIEEEAKKLKMVYEQKEKEQISKYEKVDRSAYEGKLNVAASSSGRSVEFKPMTDESFKEPLGTHQHQLQQKQNFQLSQTFQSQLDPVNDPELNDIVKSCINQYKNMMLANQNVITNEDSFNIYHERNKSGALLKYEDSKGNGNPRYVKEYKEILEYEIEQIFKNFKIQLEEIKRNLILEAEQSERLKEEQIKKDKIFAQELAKRDKLKMQRESSIEKNVYEQKIRALELEVKEEQLARYEAERRRCEAEEIASKKKKEAGFFMRFFLAFFGHHHRN